MQRRGQSFGHCIAMVCPAQPRTVLQHPHPRGRENTHLRRQLTALLAAMVELRCQLVIEKHNGFAQRYAVLRATKAQHVHARVPLDLLGRDVQCRHGIRKARSIHVNFQPQPLRGLVQRVELGD